MSFARAASSFDRYTSQRYSDGTATCIASADSMACRFIRSISYTTTHEVHQIAFVSAVTCLAVPATTPNNCVSVKHGTQEQQQHRFQYMYIIVYVAKAEIFCSAANSPVSKVHTVKLLWHM